MRNAAAEEDDEKASKRICFNSNYKAIENAVKHNEMEKCHMQKPIEPREHSDLEPSRLYHHLLSEITVNIDKNFEDSTATDRKNRQ